MESQPLWERTADSPQPVSAAAQARLEAEIAQGGAVPVPDPAADDGEAVGRTMFDTPTSEDQTVTVLIPREHLERVPAQALVRIRSRGDGRCYLGIVVRGPFAEPDGLRPDAPLIVTTTVRGGVFVPRYHGRVQIEIMGEEVEGALVPPRYRPLPNSPVYVLDAEATARVLQVEGDLRLGPAIGLPGVIVRIPARRKSVLPRHLAVLGTTGSGKSTTVARLIAEAQRAGLAVIVLDVEGEYTAIDQPTTDPLMVRALDRAGLAPAGVPDTVVYTLVDRSTSNPAHPRRVTFALDFSRLSPYLLMEILGLTEAQQQRFLRAYDTARLVLRDLGLFPRRDAGRPLETDERRAADWDEFSEGYPGLTLDLLFDIVNAYYHAVARDERSLRFLSEALRNREESFLKERLGDTRNDNATSWRTLLGKLWQVRRLRVFDRSEGALDYAQLLQPGRVNIIDLSDTESPQLNNLVIADLLRGVQQAQEERYRRWEEGQSPPVPVLIIIEEAHEFLAEERSAALGHVFAEVARIAKRGRKRWLGLVFVTQLPQHLPRPVFGLVNNYILHKISDPLVVQRLREAVGGIDEGLWRRLPALAPGQAIVSFTSLARPLLVAIDPAPCRLRLTE